ncbi:MAG: C4-type zinc ribbon domain-containing protein [Candidatus Saccharicenans sp.]|nr:C4-type zinc ribbon domain-containing protein [Candidatus Saccharicenans sp.]MDH7575299.1 C4-type zinc ribbon domain-containing protein [Candidatus Saccharicenans sp.]
MDGVDADFEKLIQLQELDNALRQVTAELSDIPRLIEQVEKKIKADSDLVVRAKERLAQNQKKRRDLEAEVKDLKAQIAKYKRQLNEVKSNKEYTSLLKEIQETQEKIDRLEEEIIRELLVADEIEEEIRTASLKQKNEEEHLKQEIAALTQRKQSLEAEKDQLSRKREELVPGIAKSQLQLYQSIARKRAGIALSRVIEEFCSMCQLRIRPQMLNEIRDRSKLHLCESCGRILYFDYSEESKEEAEESSR